jgi:hypothetical protein
MTPQEILDLARQQDVEMILDEDMEHIICRAAGQIPHHLLAAIKKHKQVLMVHIWRSQPIQAPVDRPTVTPGPDAEPWQRHKWMAWRQQRGLPGGRWSWLCNLAKDQGFFEGDKPSHPKFWYLRPASEKQIAALSRRGIDAKELTRGEASDLLDTPTPKQINCLKRHNSYRDDMTAAEARAALDELFSKESEQP